MAQNPEEFSSSGPRWLVKQALIAAEGLRQVLGPRIPKVRSAETPTGFVEALGCLQKGHCMAPFRQQKSFLSKGFRTHGRSWQLGFGITGSWRFCVWVTNVAVGRQFNHNHPSGRDKELRISAEHGVVQKLRDFSHIPARGEMIFAYTRCAGGPLSHFSGSTPRIVTTTNLYG